VSLPDPSVLGPALDAIPVFPLPGVVLFPRAILPLHVFEPRYRSMLADVLASHACMVMAFAVSDADPPAIARIAGAGVVLRHHALPDGRSNILLHGVARVRLEELPFLPPYRRARAALLEDTGPAVRDVDVATLRSAAASFVAEARQRGAEVEFELPDGSDASTIADLCAHHLVLDPSGRQRALESLDVAARVLLVTGELVAQTARLTRRGVRSDN
jgi:Lon protease-like protein